MAFDPQSGDVLLFGGYNGTSYLDDTWEFNGTSWSEVCSSCGPSARDGASLVATSPSGTLVLFGGYNGTSYLGDTWTWSGTSWSEACLSSCTPPGPRAFAAAPSAGSGMGGAALIFGGYNGTNYLAGTWTWNGSTWTKIDTSCSTKDCSSPAPRAYATISYSPTLGDILTSGYNGSFLKDTWALLGGATPLSPQRWVEVCGSCAPESEGAVQAYSLSGNENILFGGYNGTSYLGATDTFAGASWYYARDPSSGLPIDVISPSGSYVSTDYTYDSAIGSPQLLETKVVSTILTETTYVYDTSNYMNNLCWSYPGSVGADPDNDGDYSYDTDGDSGSGQAGAGEVSCSNPPVGATVYAYNSLGEVTSVTDPMGNTTSYLYNANGEVTSVTDPMGNVTSYGYDAYGNRNSVTDPLGNKTTSAYSLDSQLTSSVAPDGNVSGQNPGAYTTSYTYEPSGQLKSVTAPGSRTTSYQYDAAGNLVSTTDPMSRVTTSTYDANGRLCWSYLGSVSNPSCGSPPSGATLHYYVDSTTTESRVVDPNGNATSYTYEDRAYPGSKTSVTDALGNVTSIAYDANGRVCYSIPGNLFANGYSALGTCPGVPVGSSVSNAPQGSRGLWPAKPAQLSQVSRGETGFLNKVGDGTLQSIELAA